MSNGLFSSLKLRGLTLANRIVVSPMCQYSAIEGSATDWHLVHLGQFAISGAGLVVIEATHVEPRGRITEGCLGLYDEANARALEPVVAYFRKYGSAKLGMQLSHSGRKGSAHRPWIARGKPLAAGQGAWRTVGCSGLPFADGWPQPEALDAQGLAEVCEAHAHSARLAARIGIDLIELHIAHGYLLHEFLSPLTNRRTDGYGGSREARMRFPLDVFRAVRAAWPDDRPLGVRVSATDWIEGGWSLDDTLAFARALQGLGCDYLAVSSGGLGPEQSIPIGEGHQVPFARRVRQELGLPSLAVGMIYEPEHADRIVRDGDADLVALARGMLFDPHWPWFAAARLGENVAFPPQYVRAYKSDFLRSKRRGDV